MRLERILPLALSLVCWRAPVVGAQYPTSPPPARPIEPAEFPPFQETRLPNGLTIVLVENHRQPVLSLSLSVPAGDAYDPVGKEGLAGLVAGLLTKGTPTRSAEAIAEAIEGVGGTLSASTSKDFLTIRANGLATDASLALSLLAESLTQPTFPESELELLRTQLLSNLQLELSQPGSIAQRIFDRELWTPHPYGRSPTPESIGAITRDDLQTYQRDMVRPDGALLVASGAIPMAELERLATDAFASWNAEVGRRTSFPPPPSTHAQEIVLVHRPGSVQSNIVVGNTTFPPRDEGLYAATVANQVLGGGTDARLFLILREEKSWTYGAYSSLINRKDLGDFLATAEVRTEVTDSALQEMLTQLRRIRTEPVSSEELDAAKGSLVGSFPLTIETAGQVAAQVARTRLFDLSPDYLATYRTRLSAVTASELQQAAVRSIRPDEAVVVVVGDATKILEPLERIRPVRLLNPDGTGLARGDLGLAPGGLEFDPALLAERSDSFSILVQGNTLGGQRISLTPNDSGLVYREDLQIAGMIQQHTEIWLTPDGQARTVTQTGQVQGQPTSIAVVYDSGRVTGTAETVGPTGLQKLEIDTTLTAGAIDDNLLQALLPAAAWAPDATWSFTSFSAGQASESVLQLSVKAVETVAVPAGTFEAYRADLVGGPAVLTMWVSVEAPHRLLKLTLAGSALEFVLVR